LRKITQTRDDNCLQAAVASILGLTLEDVPDFGQHDDWEIRFMDFMELHGEPVVMTPYGSAVSGIACGRTVRQTKHMVVVKDGRIVWDPHPSRAGLLNITHVYATGLAG
jgi:hypothetical protein